MTVLLELVKCAKDVQHSGVLFIELCMLINEHNTLIYCCLCES